MAPVNRIFDVDFFIAFRLRIYEVSVIRIQRVPVHHRKLYGVCRGTIKNSCKRRWIGYKKGNWNGLRSNRGCKRVAGEFVRKRKKSQPSDGQNIQILDSIFLTSKINARSRLREQYPSANLWLASIFITQMYRIETWSHKFPIREVSQLSAQTTHKPFHVTLQHASTWTSVDHWSSYICRKEHVISQILCPMISSECCCSIENTHFMFTRYK